MTRSKFFLSIFAPFIPLNLLGNAKPKTQTFTLPKKEAKIKQYWIVREEYLYKGEVRSVVADYYNLKETAKEKMQQTIKYRESFPLSSKDAGWRIFMYYGLL